MPNKSTTFRYTPTVYKTLTDANGVRSFEVDTRNYGPFTNSVTFGANVTGYKQRMKSGTSATTTLTGKRTRIIKPGYFSAHAVRPTAVGIQLKSVDVVGFLNSPSPPNNVLFQDPNGLINAENTAKIAFVRRAKSVTRKFQGGVFLGELAEAVRMIKRPAGALRSGIGDYLNALKKRRQSLPVGGSRGVTAQRILSESWLEYSFGWTPLVNDVEQGARAIADMIVSPQRPKLEKVSGKGSHSEVAFSGTMDVCSLNLGVLKGIRTDVVTADVRYYGGVRTYHPSSVPFRHYGVNLREFVPTAWELMPWSFLIDYFANVGDIIECATLMWSEIGWANKATRKSTKVSCASTKYVDTVSNTSYGFTSGMQASYEYVEVQRSPVTGPLIPLVQTRVPGVGRKLANLAALLPQLKRLTPFS